jgi:hypothetical protein
LTEAGHSPARAQRVAAPGEDCPVYVEGLNTHRRFEIIADALLRRGYPTRVVRTGPRVFRPAFYFPIRARKQVWRPAVQE